MFKDDSMLDSEAVTNEAPLSLSQHPPNVMTNNPTTLESHREAQSIADRADENRKQHREAEDDTPK